jgi:uncharacterized protein
MKIAVVGSGIAGLAAAYHLHADHHVWLYEAQRRLGGHTDTHAIAVDGRVYDVDSGFIVYNETNYPGLTAWLRELDVASQPTDMSFSVSNRSTGLEYGTDSLRSLLCQPRNALRPNFWIMLADLWRFNREAPSALESGDIRALGEYLRAEGYRAPFVRDHLLPMCAAIWSQPAAQVERMRIDNLVAFLVNHHLLQLHDRPEWRVVSGGSGRYVDAFRARFRGRLRVDMPVRAIRRQAGGVQVTAGGTTELFDGVVLACHSDDALRLLLDPSGEEREILSAIGYHGNTAVLHSDERAMPQRRGAWSSWNAQVGVEPEAETSVTYWMNRLQSLPGRRQFFVTLNPPSSFAPSRVWAERHYRHPVLDAEAVAAQQRLNVIQGVRRTWYCGAWCGWGFHEDGFASGVGAARMINGHGVSDRAA